MNESIKSRLLPLGSILTILLLAGVLFVVTVRNRAETDDKLPPLTAMWAAIVTTAAVFLVERRLQNYLWGVLAGVLLIVYPVFRQQLAQLGGKDVLNVLEEGLVLGTLVCTMFAWDLVYLPRFTWWSWLVALGSIFGCVALVGFYDTAAGVRSAALAAVGLLVVIVLSIGYPAARDVVVKFPEPPSPWNRLAALFTLLVGPAGGVALAWLTQNNAPMSAVTEPATWTDLWAALPGWPEDPYRPFTLSRLETWCLPSVYVVLPLLAWAFWRTVRRGWLQWRRGQAPLAWLLTLYTIHTLVSVSLVPTGNDAVAVLALTALMILLLVFWSGDLLQGMLERMLLRPPEERTPEATLSRGR